jgi:hypothetical protein
MGIGEERGEADLSDEARVLPVTGFKRLLEHLLASHARPPCVTQDL